MAREIFSPIKDQAKLSSLEEQGLVGLYEHGGVTVCRVRALDLMNPDRRVKLEQELLESACAGFNREQSKEFADDVARHLREGTLYTAMSGGVAVGFAVMRDFPEIHGTYMAGIVKKPEAPSGIVESMVRYHINSNGYEVVTVRTQNDRVMEIIMAVCRLVVPVNREAVGEEFEILKTMGLIACNVGEDLVARSHYGGAPMISSLARRRSNNPAVVRVTDRLNYDQGDALLAVGYI